MRKKKLMLNTVSSILHQIIAIVCGFILPRQILLYYGSEVNGLVSSITQFLGFVTIMDMGVGAVVQSSLYMPLSANDYKKTSQIMSEAKKFFKRIGIILCIYSVLLMIFYPQFIEQPMDRVSTAILVFSISLSMIAQYFFGITNQLLLNADQKSYIQQIAATITTLLNTILGVFFIKRGASIQVIKLISSMVLLMRPLILYIYVQKNYKIDKAIKYDKDPLTQKWDALYQHIATFVVDKTDIVVLTMFSSLTNVSVYTVYHLVVNALYQFFVTAMSGIQSLLGDMIAKREKDKLDKTVNQFEVIIHALACLLYGCSAILIIPFIKVYTKGVNDASYINGQFSWLITIAYFFCSTRAFYSIIIKAAGHYKQTQKGATIEAILNVGISIAMVPKFGLVGVAIGTLFAMAYRTAYFVLYLNKNIIYRDIKYFIKHVVVDSIYFCLITIMTSWMHIDKNSYFKWLMMAVSVTFISVVVLFVLHMLFYKNEVKSIVNTVKRDKL